MASRPRGRNGAAAGEHGPGLGRPMTVTLVGVITLMKASSMAVSLSIPNAPGETLDPVPPGLAMATLCVVLPLEGVALELVSAGGTCGFGGGWASLLAPLGVVSPWPRCSCSYGGLDSLLRRRLTAGPVPVKFPGCRLG